MKTITEPQKNLQIIDEYDVLVLGGGVAGVSAALSAARCGAKTALIERYGYLGGQATGGLVILIVGLTDGKNPIFGGNCREMIYDLSRLGAAQALGRHVLFNPEYMKLLLDSKLLENNVNLYYHRYVAGAITENGKIKAVITEGKSGRHAIAAKMFVDATGDADLAKYCDIPYNMPEKNNLMPVTLGFRVGGLDLERVGEFIRNNYTHFREMYATAGVPPKVGGWVRTMNPNEAWFNVAHAVNIDPTDSESLTDAELETRRRALELVNVFKEKIPGFENGYIIDTAAQIGVRDSRRIKGLYTFEEKDISSTFDDTIALAPNYTGKGGGSVEVPYSCLVTEKVENVVFCGRCISVAHELLDMFREIPCCMATGQAAGIAVALAVNENRNLQDVNVSMLRKTLLEQNAILAVP
ncbi:MAG: FAD-dependent oxidoreductase [Candidatus Gastranaerophilales bacterium]|nr:FAD-dependent oxidoreductase [Candidatus Gastranaerophilales bacterium]